MPTTAWAATALLAMSTASALAARPVQKDLARTARLNPRIGPANPQQYNSVLDGKDWKNPYLVVRREGVEVIAKGLPSGRKIVPVADLRRALINLPVTAWPYGRVVVVQDLGLISYPRDLESIASNREAALALLKTLQIVVERWPGA